MSTIGHGLLVDRRAQQLGQAGGLIEGVANGDFVTGDDDWPFGFEQAVSQGGEAVIRYKKRNVLGFSMDFAEDVTKTNWGVEFTWIGSTPVINADSFTNTSNVDTMNLTISVDRPTFIHFLNPNRTFFFNTQWFVNYIPDYAAGYTTTGPVNLLFTFTVSTGYYQDRLLPSMVLVYDVMSASGAGLPQVTYRFNENFSATVGLGFFFGRTELTDMAVNPIGPTSNRIGPDAYKNAVETGIALVRDRDEIFFRLRYTF